MSTAVSPSANRRAVPSTWRGDMACSSCWVSFVEVSDFAEDLQENMADDNAAAEAAKKRSFFILNSMLGYSLIFMADAKHLPCFEALNIIIDSQTVQI